MQIEARYQEGLYAKAYVRSLGADGVKVAYENQWRADEVIPYEECRVVKDGARGKPDFKKGEIVEAYFKKGNQPVELWQKVRVRDLKVSDKTNKSRFYSSFFRVSSLSLRTWKMRENRTSFNRIPAALPIRLAHSTTISSSTCRSMFLMS
jgi:hypothetical protein